MNALVANTGQICFAATRVYVQAGIYDEFVQKYRAAFEAKHNVIGDPDKQGTEIGPVVDKAQFERVMGIISTAKAEKAGTLLAGGERIGSKVSHNNHSLERASRS